MDYLTLEESKGGFANILVITDHFTKYAVAIPTKNQTAKTTAEALLNNFILRYGIPTRLHSDQGANFESETIRELCKLMNIERSRTTPYRPQGNGLTERYNRTLISMLGTLQQDQKKNWKDYVSALTFAYNCTKHESTKFSPYELLFGRKPRLPIDIQLETSINILQNKEATKYLESLRKRISDTTNIVRRHTEKAREKQKINYDQKAKAAQLLVGDKVLVRRVVFEGKHKIADKFEDEVYTIIAQTNPDIPVYSVRSESGRDKKIHRNLLFPIGERVDSEGTEVTRDNPEPTPKPRKLRKSFVPEDNRKGKDEGKRDSSVPESKGEYTVEESDSEEEGIHYTFQTGDAHTSSKESKGEPSVNVAEPTVRVDESGSSNEVTTADATDLRAESSEESEDSREESEVSEDDVFEEDTAVSERNHQSGDASVADTQEEANRTGGGQSPQRPTPQPRRSSRDRRPPSHFADFYVGRLANSNSAVRQKSPENRLKTLSEIISSGALNSLDPLIANRVIDCFMNK